MKSLFQLYREHQGKVSDKWSIYLAEYDRVFSEYRNKPVRMLEIGIQNGGSLEIWGKYFEAAELFVGCDINPDCAQLSYEDPRVQVVVGDANAVNTKIEILSHSAQYDLIIDDGSHYSSDIVKSFSHYFRHLKQGGIFVAEDLHCSYWKAYEGGLYYPYSSLAFFKRLVDIVNHEHWGIAKERKQLIRGFSEEYQTDFDEWDLAQIHSIEFFNSVCIVRKRAAQSNVLGERFIAGTADLVMSGLQVTPKNTLDESEIGNPWTTMAVPPDEEWPVLTQQIAQQSGDMAGLRDGVLRLRDEVESLNQIIAEQERKAAALHSSMASEIAQREAHIASLYQSSSWRVTQPMRWVSTQVKRSRRLAKLAPVLIEHGGGVAGTVKKAVRIYRREGVPGIKRVIRGVTPAGLDESIVHGRNDYDEWIACYDTLKESDRTAMRAIQADFKQSPLISVVMPTYNPKPEWLVEAIESVRKQIYGNWELCIADDASTNSVIRPILEKYAREDERIKIVIRQQNGHISASSNSALELVSGQWVALLDHDDLLSEHALFWVAECINRSPDVQLIYSDEDKITETGKRFAPHFKCDWNLDLFYSHNMLSHLGVYKTELVREIGGFRVGLEGAQDYDLALRCIEKLQNSQIHHIPRVLYHWRVHAESTAMGADKKPYAAIAGERALNEHFERTGVRGKVEFLSGGYMPTYDLPADLPLVSIIIPTRNGLTLLKQCIDSVLEKTSYKNYEIIVVDNGSDDVDTLRYLEKISKEPGFIVIRDDSPFNYSRLNNKAVELANGEIIALLNNDIEVISPDWLSVMVAHALRPDVGAVGAKLLYSDGRLQHGGVIIGIGGVAGHAHKYLHEGAYGYFSRAALTQNFSAVTAACLVVRKSIYEQVEGLNEESLSVAFNDVDFCLRVLEAGYRNVWSPLAVLYHHESATRGAENTPEKQARFSKEVDYMLNRWEDIIKYDPAYSPNLTLSFEDFSYAWPPRVPALSEHENLRKNTGT